jgi:hypothetical protein
MHVSLSNSIHPNALTNQNQRQPPAKAARELLQSRPDLVSEPFGKLVSLFAQGQPVPPAPTDSNSATTTDPNAGDTSSNTAGT